jgi:thiol peroxidase
MSTITLNGTELKTAGTLPAIGTQAPDFTVTKTDLGEIHLRDYLGKKVLLNVFPSLDTPTCAEAMRQFNNIAKQLPEVLILCISADLPFAQKRFCLAESLSNVYCASVFRHPDFGKKYGVTIIDQPLQGLLSRAILALDEKGNIIYTEQVKEISQEPDYQAVMKAIK